MTTQTREDALPRAPLSRERVLQGAVELADREGIASLTMRNLAHELGVEAMSLYYHVANKEEVLDGIVDLIAAEVNVEVAGLKAPSTPDEWKGAVRNRVLASRQVMLRHPWAPGVLESRTKMSPQVVLYYDGLLGLLRTGGFSFDTAHHAMHAFGSRALGFTQELFDPGDQQEGEEAADELLEEMASQLPHLVGMLSEIAHDDPDSTLGWCDDQTEFEFGLDLILDGLDRMRRTTV